VRGGAREDEELCRYMEELEAVRRKAARRLIHEESQYVEKLGQDALRRVEEEDARRRARAEEERKTAEEEARLALERAAEKQRREEEQARLRKLAQQKKREEEEEERRLRAEQEARHHAEAEQKLREKQKEAALLARQTEMKALVDAFLQEHHFNSVSATRRNMLRTTCPLHRAAELGNSQVVRALLEVRADPLQLNSSGKTAYAAAKKKDKKGSHDAVLNLLTQYAVPPSVANKSHQRGK